MFDFRLGSALWLVASLLALGTRPGLCQSWLLPPQPENAEARDAPPPPRIAVRDLTKESRRDAFGFPLPVGPVTRIGWAGLAAGQQIHGVWFSPDEETIVGRVIPDRLVAWDAAGAPLWVLETSEGLPPRSLGMETGLLTLAYPGKLEFRSPRTGELKKSVSLRSSAFPMAVDPAQTWVVGAHKSPAPPNQITVYRWDLPSGRLRWKHATDSGTFQLQVQGPRVLLDRKVRGGTSRVVEILDLASGKPVFREESPEATAGSTLILEGTALVLGRLNDSPIRIDLASGKRDEPYVGRGHAVCTDPQGRVLLSGHPVVWDARSGKVLCQPPTSPPWTWLAWNQSAMAVSPKGTAFALANQRIVPFDVASGKPRLDPSRQGILGELRIAPGGKIAAAVDSKGNLSSWDLVTGERKEIFPGAFTHSSPIAISPDGLVVSGVSPSGQWVQGRLNGTGSRGQRVVGRVAGHAEISRDGKWLLLQGPGRTTFTVNHWGSPQETTSIELSRATYGGPYSFRLSADGRLAIFNQEDQTLQLREAKTGKHLGSLPNVQGFGSLSPDGRWFLKRGNKGGYTSTEVWTTEPLERTHDFSGAGDERAAVFLRGDRLLQMSPDHRGKLYLQDLRSGETRNIRHPALAGVRFLVTDPQELVLATVEGDGTALIWDLPQLLETATED